VLPEERVQESDASLHWRAIRQEKLDMAVGTSGIAYMVDYTRSCDVEMGSDGE